MRRSALDRFAARMPSLPQPVGQCWEWPGATNSDGYGYMRAWRELDGVTIRCTHVLSFVHHKGPVPAGKEVTHSCDNRLCWNPEHLDAKTHHENMLDCAERDRVADRYGPLNPNWKGGITYDSAGYQRMRKA